MPPRERKTTPLTDDEIDDLRAILESDARVRWFWGGVKTWGVGIGAVIAGVTIGFEALAKVVKWLATGK